MSFIPATNTDAELSASEIGSSTFSLAAIKRGRVIAGALAAAGSMVIIAGGHGTANAATATKTTVSKATTTRTALQPVEVGKYTIRSGDTLSAIASRSGVSLNALVAANGISVRRPIQIGQHLVLPTAAAKTGTLSSTGVMPTDLPKNSARFALKPTFASAATQYGVPLDLLEAMTWNESGWQMSVVSHTGAIGIGQLMPSAIDYVNTYLVSKPLNAKSADGNIRISASYLHYLINLNKGDYRAALADYYQGHASVKQVGVGSDTKQYVANVLALKARYF